MKKIIGFITMVMMVLIGVVACDTEQSSSVAGEVSVDTTTKNSGDDSSSESSSGSEQGQGVQSTTTTTIDVNDGKIFKLTLDNQGATTEGLRQIFLKYNDGYYLDRACECKIGYRSDPIECPAKIGWTFLGYNTDKNGNGQLIITDTGYRDVDVAYTEYSSDGTLYAIWSANAYAIQYNGNLGTGSMANQPMTYDTEIALTANAYTRTGYKFLGWNTDSQATEALYTDTQNVKNLASENGTIVSLYAVWQANTYKVVFNNNGGSDEMEDQTFIYDEEQNLTNCGFTAPTGLKFGGWNTDADGQGDTFADGAAVKNLTATANGSVTLYAQWIDKSAHSITYNNTKSADNSANIKSYKESQKVELEDISVIGYTFNGWYEVIDGVISDTSTDGWAAGSHSADVVLSAQWTANQYQIDYKDKGGEIFSGTMSGEPTTHTYDTVTALVSPTKTGYDFGGWYMDSNCSGTSITEIGGTAITANTTLYAKWDIVTYNITYQNENAVNNNVSSYTILDEVELTGVTRTGYTFDGWYEVIDGIISDTSTDGWNAGRTGAVTLQAQWIANQYQIIYKDENNQTFSGTHGANYPAVYTYDQNATLDTPHRDGYEFAGWHLRADCTDNAITALASSTYTDAITLYAKWILGNGTITVVAPTYQDINNLLSYADGTFTALSGYQSYHWYIDEESQSEVSQTFTPDTSSLLAGEHSVMVIVTDSQGGAYSAEMTFQVKKSY